MINEPVDASLYKYPWIISSKLFSTTLFLLSLSAVKILNKLRHVGRQMSRYSFQDAYIYNIYSTCAKAFWQ